MAGLRIALFSDLLRYIWYCSSNLYCNYNYLFHMDSVPKMFMRNNPPTFALRLNGASFLSSEATQTRSRSLTHSVNVGLSLVNGHLPYNISIKLIRFLATSDDLWQVAGTEMLESDFAVSPTVHNAVQSGQKNQEVRWRHGDVTGSDFRLQPP